MKKNETPTGSANVLPVYLKNEISAFSISEKKYVLGKITANAYAKAANLRNDMESDGEVIPIEKILANQFLESDLDISKITVDDIPGRLWLAICTKINSMPKRTITDAGDGVKCIQFADGGSISVNIEFTGKQIESAKVVASTSRLDYNICFISETCLFDGDKRLPSEVADMPSWVYQLLISVLYEGLEDGFL